MSVQRGSSVLIVLTVTTLMMLLIMSLHHKTILFNQYIAALCAAKQREWFLQSVHRIASKQVKKQKALSQGSLLWRPSVSIGSNRLNSTVTVQRGTQTTVVTSSLEGDGKTYTRAIPQKVS